jgi:DNA (cytosine-5)-methyltransferase 1
MSALTYGSVCSGIEAASAAWHPLGWKASFFSEIEAFPRSVLAHHYPETPLHGDFTTIKAGEYEPIDLLVGGTPCQSFSVAGLRGGLDDDRGNLALEYLRLADRLRPRWLVWENVPGVLSSNGGRDFGAILGGMVELGYGVAYRVLDAQFFGVAQRRRRVFVVGYLGDWRRAAAVLFERHSLSGNPAPRREKGPGVAALTANGVGTCGADDNQGQAGHLIAHTLKGEGFDASEDGTGRGTPIVPVAFSIMPMNSGKDFKGRETNVSQPVMAAGPTGGNQGGDYIVQPAVAYAIQERAVCENPNAGPDGAGFRSDDAAYTLEARTVPQAVAHVSASPTLRAGGNATGGNRPQGTDADTAESLLTAGSAVRRLTPRECERLQGFPEITNELRILVCRSEDEKHALASSAARGSAALALGPSAPVAVNVLIDLERQVLQLHSAGKSSWSASIAELESSSLPPMPSDAFALLAVLMNAAVANSTRIGRAESPQSTKPFIHPLNGSAFVALSGPEITERASDAAWFIDGLTRCSRSTTSPLGSNDPTFASTLETLSCCVAIAMAGFIPEAMRSGCSYEIRFTTHHGYTSVPHRGKPAADGPRYKALGNSMAVPCMRWIGERIQAVEAVRSLEQAA